MQRSNVYNVTTKIAAIIIVVVVIIIPALHGGVNV
jgi:hypothetical protein